MDLEVYDELMDRYSDLRASVERELFSFLRGKEVFQVGPVRAMIKDVPYLGKRIYVSDGKDFVDSIYVTLETMFMLLKKASEETLKDTCKVE